MSRIISKFLPSQLMTYSIKNIIEGLYVVQFHYEELSVTSQVRYQITKVDG